MSIKAIIGGILLLVFALIGALGTVSFNGETVESRPLAILYSLTLMPLVVIIVGFIFGGMRTALISFFKETLAFFRKRTG